MNMQSIRKWFTHLSTLLLMITSLAATLLFSEYFVRYFYPQRLYFNVSQWDPYVGFSAVPNIEGFSRHQDYTMHIKINSRGLRDREFSFEPPADTLRIGVFGDSFTFGEGVQNDETYPKILERLLNGDGAIIRSKRRIEVLNFGLGKTGTSHQLAWYQKEGRKYKLDLVILGFLGGNDFSDNWGGVFYLRDGQLVHNPTAYSSVRKIQSVVYKIPFYSWLAANSHLVNLARQTATIIDDKIRRQSSVGRNLESEVKATNDADIYRLTLRLIEEFREQALNDRARFMVVNIAGKNQKPLSDYPSQLEIKPNVAMSAMLMNDLARQDTRVLDLVPVFSRLPVSEYYFEHDGHINLRGHEVVAQKIYENILPDVLRMMRH